MCLGIPAKVVSLDGDMALIDASGVKREVAATLLSDVDPGDYVLVHAGFALAKITDTETDETRRLLSDLAED